MTDTQQEYIITEERLKRFENGGYFDVLLKEIRTHPHSRAPAISMQCEYVSPDNKFCKDLAPRYDGERWLCAKHYDAAITRAATLAVLDKIDGLITSEEIKIGLCPRDFEFKSAWKGFLEELKLLRKNTIKE